jgi:hypothetical protein
VSVSPARSRSARPLPFRRSAVGTRPAGGVRSRAARRARSELVAALNGVWSKDQARALPLPFDDLTTDFGNDVYEQMLLDPQVSAAVVVLKTSILEDGLMLSPAVEDQEAPNYERAVEVRDIARRMFDRLDTPLDDVLWAMLDGLWAGNKVAELVSELQTVDGKQLLQLTAIKPKPRQAVAFVVDAYMNVLGLIGARPGQAGPTSPAAPILAPDSSQIIPRDKFAIFTHRPVDGDPRGTSVLRSAYTPWWRKRQLEPEYLKYLAQFASPAVWAAPPEGVEDSLDQDPLGNLVDGAGAPLEDPDAEGADLPEPISPADELLALLLDWQNSAVLVVPPGTSVNVVETRGDGQAFLSAFDHSNAEIVKAVLAQQLATEEGRHQARSAAQVHQDVLDTLVRQAKRALLRMVYSDILVPWVARNWGDEAAESLVPVPSLGTTEQQDLAPLMTAVAALMRAAYFHSSQLPALDALLGLPVRDQTQPNQLQPQASPAPGEPSAPGGGEMGRGGTDRGNTGAPSGPARRGGRGARPARDARPSPPGQASAAAEEEEAFGPPGTGFSLLEAARLIVAAVEEEEHAR